MKQISWNESEPQGKSLARSFPFIYHQNHCDCAACLNCIYEVSPTLSYPRFTTCLLAG